MLRRITVIVIVALLCNQLTAYAQTNTSSQIKFKRQVVEYGTNQNVKVKLTSNIALEGRIAEIRNDSFTLQLVDQTGQVISREISYTELSKVSKVGRQKAASALKRGALYGAGFYAGMLLVGLVVIGVVAATSR